MEDNQESTSWGNYFKTHSDLRDVSWLSQIIKFEEGEQYLACGLKRSYGDCCLNDQSVLINLRNLDKFISFDSTSGVLECQSGVSLAEILDFAVPRNWFLPVSPGTKFVTVGGAIANDVHGKNHHSAGTFGENVLSLVLLRSNGEILNCSQEENQELFKATIAGIGLTGIILSAKIKLKPINSAFMQCDNIFFDNLDEFLEVSKEYSSKYEYTVAWMDCASKNENFGRGIFMCANHSEQNRPQKHKKIKLFLPVYFPNGLLNNIFVSTFNQTYFYLKKNTKHGFISHYDPYFYPLDAVSDWNRVYGKRGFFQFQCVVPSSNTSAFFEVFNMLKSSKNASYLTVVKEFSDRKPAGLMSFPRKGITICFDIPNRGADTLKFIQEMNNYVCTNGGALYPAKDACMSQENYKQSFPNLEEFMKLKDPLFSSSFWRRVNS